MGMSLVLQDVVIFTAGSEKGFFGHPLCDTVLGQALDTAAGRSAAVPGSEALAWGLNGTTMGIGFGFGLDHPAWS